jgi:hypothetical protein
MTDPEFARGDQPPDVAYNQIGGLPLSMYDLP